MIETHISWVLLAGEFAYKIKKPLRLPFVDYGTAELRLACCREELRINRRLAAPLYLDVVRITGSVDDPAIEGTGPALEHAVRMRRFGQDALFGAMARRGALTSTHIDDFARTVAAFHTRAARAQQQRLSGGLGTVADRSRAMLAAAGELLDPAGRRWLRDWIAHEGHRLQPYWALRAAAGRVRECHGDLHLDNVVLFEGQVLAFDGIEFDPALRWIDLAAEVAFPVMDLCRYGLDGLAWRWLDGWREETGDHGVLAGPRACLVYRALVRAAVEHMKHPGCGDAEAYAAQALAWARPGSPRLSITQGLPGSGKSHRALQWLQANGGVRFRSDVERKRLLAGLPPLADTHAAGLDLYDAAATRRTYDRLLELADDALAAGYPVVLDAAFLRIEQRKRAAALAARHGAPFGILRCEAPLAVLRERLVRRGPDASEADASVLDMLQASQQPLEADELALVE